MFDPTIIIETELKFDVDKILDVYNSVKSYENQDHQIGITSTGNNDMTSGTGRIESLKFNEEDFNILNSVFADTYIEEVHNILVKQYNVIRGRFMKLSGKKCYTYHVDPTWRLHIPLIANPSSIFIIDDKVYRLPEKGKVYLVNTTLVHSAINMSEHDRLHIVYGIKT